MNVMHEELFQLANLYCEEQLTETQFDKLQTLLRSSVECQSLFVEFVQLHGQLLWNGGLTAGLSLEPIGIEGDFRSDKEINIPAASIVRTKSAQGSTSFRKPSASFRPVAAAAVCVTTAALIGLVFLRPIVSPPKTDLTATDVTAQGMMANPNQDAQAGETETVDSLPPLKLNAVQSAETSVAEDRPIPLPADPGQHGLDQSPALAETAENSDAEVVAEIDRLLRSSWQEYKVTPASAAEDHEWVRRIYLTLTGRIPTIAEASGFLQEKSPRKRDALLEQLVTQHQTAENLAVTWTNLLIGRSNARNVDQESLFAFLLKQFETNKSWMDTTGQLIAAEGRSDENGATNFLLAHLNDQATPATAVTARLFLGQQVHCTQCHDHPFARERQQQEFWSLNAFFKQAERKMIQLTDEAGKADRQVWTLADSGKPGMTFYDNRRGQQKAVLPEFGGEVIPVETKASRRIELVRLLAADSEHQVARAMINRMWAQFFGYGFTNPIDDLGAHNPVSHPELFDYLTNAFVKSDYDMRRLMKWLSMSEAFQLSSVQSEEAYVIDDPQEGGVPLFSRAYSRHMGPEQVYESIRTAIRSVSDQPIDSSLGTEHRREWVEQFVQSYGTDENDEQLAFEGNISQAMLMMNGEDLAVAIPLAANEVTKALRENAMTDAPERLAMATLNRLPTENEEQAFRNRYRTLSRSLPADQAVQTATEDLLWAYLNSSEFVSVH